MKPAIGLFRVTLPLLAIAIVASQLACAPTLYAADADSPIRILRCAVPGRSVLLDPFNGFRSEVAAGTELRFVNRAGSAATRVAMTVRYAGTTETVVEVGAFAPGITIAKQLSAFEGVPFGGEQARCRVTAASFIDGSSWGQ